MTRQRLNATAGTSILERKLESWRDARQDLLASPTEVQATWLTRMFVVHGCFKVLGSEIFIPIPTTHHVVFM